MNRRCHLLAAYLGLTVFLLCTMGGCLRAQGMGYAWLEFGTRDTIVARVGEPVYFDAVVRDVKGDTIRNWDSIGLPIELRVIGSDAEIDTSMASWSARSDDYTWLTITRDGNELVRLGPQRFLVDAAEFVEGVVHLAFVSSKAETGTRIEAAPYIDSLISRSPPITRFPLAADNFLVDWTSQQQGENVSTFFLECPIELIVTPRDRFTNPATTALDVALLVNFSHEFSLAPGYPFPPFISTQSIRGEQAFQFVPDTSRVRARSNGYVITAYSPTDYSISGKCDSFYVADHAPSPFPLLSPGDDTELTLDHWDDPVIFRWERPVPPDPYMDIRISRHDSQLHSDTVRYRIHFADADSLANEMILEADGGGTAAVSTCTEEALAAIADTLSGTPDVRRFEMIYFVEAADGVGTTWSTPVDTTSPGHRITVVNELVDKGVALQFAGNEPIQRVAGEAVDFALVALDKNDAVVADWNVNGRTTILRVQNSAVESDTSARSWGDDPDGYSWARLEVEGTIIPSSAPGEYHIPKTLFVNGRASATYAGSKAEKQVRMEIHPLNPRWNQTSPPMDWRPAALDNILMDITWPHPERRAVYLERPFELYIATRDRFLNPLEEETALRLDPRFPGEIVLAGDSARRPLEALLQVSGESTVLLLSTAVRGDSTDEVQMQRIRVHALVDTTVRSDVSYNVLEHAPLPFALKGPPDRTEFRLESWYSEKTFSWEQPVPPDPYSNIAVSRFSGTRNSDTVRYMLHMLSLTDMQTDLTFPSDDSGRAPKRTFTSDELLAIYEQFTGHDTSGSLDVLWYVDAADGLNVTRSNPVDSILFGYRLRLTVRNPPAVTPMHIPLAANTGARFTIDNGRDFCGTDLRLSVTGAVDTLGFQWWNVAASGGQSPIPALYRNGADGLHVARDTASGFLSDRLWLPARCAVGDNFPMGRILATGSIDCGGLSRATVTVDYGGFGIWTWVDSIGLLSVEQGGEAFRLAEIDEWLYPLEPRRAQEQAVPFARDDLLVYLMAGDGSPEWKFNIFRSLGEGERAWAQNYPSIRSYLVFEDILEVEDGLSGIFFRVNERGILAEYDGRRKDSVELFPAFIPKDSTVLLNNVAWSVGRRFDTIILGAPCRAYELRRGEYYRVITDRFGEVFCTSASKICLLSSAVLRDTAYNRATQAVRWFDLCVGNRYQYRYYTVRSWMLWTEISTDTLIDGQRWYLFSGAGPLLGWFRSDSSAFYRLDTSTGRKDQLFSGSMNIGDLCRWGMVRDTMSVSVDGMMRRRIDSYEHGYGYANGWHVRLLEGIGMLNLEWHSMESTEDYQLVYADVCGVQWGVPLGIDEMPEGLPAQPTLTIAPHPLRGQGTVHIALPRPTRLRISVHDMLGRERIIVADRDLPAGASQLALPVAGLTPGVYFCRLHSGTATVVRSFLVLH